MNKSLQEELLKYATESGLIEADDESTDEFTVVTDSTVTELETEIEALAGKITETNQELDQVVEGSDAIISAESKISAHAAVLSTESFSKGYDKTVQKYLWANVVESLESINFPTQIFAELESVSFEADEPAKQAEEDSKKLKGMASRFWDMVVKAAKAAKAFFVRLLDLFRTSSEKNQRSLEILKQTYASREAGAATRENLKGSGYRDLVVNGAVDPIGALKLAADGYKEKLAPAQRKVSETLVQTAQLISAIDKTVASSQVEGKTSAQVLSSMMDSFPDAFSFKLAGGRKAEFTITKKSSGSTTVGFEVTKAVEEAPKEFPVPSLAQVESIIEVLEHNAGVIASINKEIDENIKETDKVLKATEEAAKKEVGDEHKAALSAFVSAAQGVLTNSKIFLPKYNQYALGLGHTAYKLGMAIATSYPKKGAKKDEAPKAEEKKEA